MASCLVYPGFDRMRQQATSASASASGEPTCAMQLCPWAHRRIRVTAKHLRTLLAVGYADPHHDPQTRKRETQMDGSNRQRREEQG